MIAILIAAHVVGAVGFAVAADIPSLLWVASSAIWCYKANT